MSTPRVPKELGAAGKALWRQVWAGFSTEDPREVHSVRQACRLEDDVVRLRADLDGSPLVVKGSTAQPVEAPQLKSIRDATALQQKLLASLAVEQADADARSTAGRRLVSLRYGG